MSDRYGLSADPYLNDPAELLTGLERRDRAPVRPANPSAVSHWEATRCPYEAGGRKCGAQLVTRGLATTCPVSLSHYTRVRPSADEERRTGKGKGIPNLPGRA